ncbi:MAG: efflux RND transporter periplasmic adaptor subunit, partial [Fimbriimonadaceae bacterium]
SPLSGIVTQRNADPGSLASPGNAVLVVQSNGWLFARSSIPVEQGATVRVGQVVNLTIDALPGQEFNGKISNLTQSADNESRQLGLLIRLENTDGKLRPGMFGHVSIVTKSVRANVTVPREGIKAGREGETVAVVDKDLKVSIRKVKLGIQSPKVAEILEGVKPGEQVVILSYDQLREGQTVKLSGEGRPKR